MRLVLTRDAEKFARRAEAFLAARVERNVLATVLWHALRGPPAGHAPLFGYALDARGRIRAALLRTPPGPLLATALGTASATVIVERWLAEDPEVPGVIAPTATARAIARAWERVANERSRCRIRIAYYAASAVRDPPRPAPGRLRTATGEDRELLVRWERAFVAESGVATVGDAALMVERRLASGLQLVWDDDGPACAVVRSPMIAGTVRIGPVFTPPERRRRGYAGSAVAAACRDALARGARRCVLFADLDNPTSIGIYTAVGFGAIGEWEEHDFGVPSA